MKFGKLIHLGIVVPDLEKAVSIYENILGIGPWEIKDDREFFAIMNVNGQRGLNTMNAFYRGNECEIELVMPLGEGVYADWLKEHGPGLHHVKFENDATYEEFMTAVRNVSEKKPYLEIRWPDGRPLVGYADLLEEAGLLIEKEG